VTTERKSARRPQPLAIDRDSPLPLYVQIRDQVRRHIGAGTIDTKDLTDSWLTKKFGVSRMTVRQALEQLRQEGLLEREQGRGTRLTTPVEGQLSKMERFFDEWGLQGLKVSARILKRGVQPADAHVAKVLNVAEHMPVGYFRRLRYADGQPICVDMRFLRTELLQQLTDEDLIQVPDLVLQAKLHTVFSRADMRILATAAGKAEAKALRVPVGTPLLQRLMDLYAGDGRGILCGPSYFRSDLYVYRVSVTS